MSHASRVTLDIDHEPGWRLTALRATYALRRHADDIEIRISSSGEGLHIVGWFDEPLTDDQKYRYRRHLGDDPDRVLLDEMRQSVGHVTQVLWTTKGDQHADFDFETVEAAIDHIDRTLASPSERFGEFVKHGRLAYQIYPTGV